MENIYKVLRDLAKSPRIQNLFTVSKDTHTIQLFRNVYDLSNIQNYYLSFIYMYDTISKDIICENISKKILDKDLYADSYILWKREKGYKQTDKVQSANSLHLVPAREIKFKK
jgi:hypothetical protein